MKQMSFEQMEEVKGGMVSAYCALLTYWVNGGSGYQGDMNYLFTIWGNNCPEQANS